MPYFTSLQYLNGYLRVTVTGTLESVEELFNYARLLAKEGEEHQTTRALVDERKLVDHTDLMDAYILSESDFTADMAMRGVRVACLAGPENLEQTMAFETVMQNRSLNYRVFTDEDTATAWLMR